MSDYDGKVVIRTEIDNKNANSQLMSLQNRMVKTADKINSIQGKMQALGTTQIKSKVFEGLEKELAGYESELAKVEAKMYKLYKGKDTDTKAGQMALLGNVQNDLLDKIELVEAKIKKMKSDGTNLIDPKSTSEWAKLDEQLKYATNDMDLLTRKQEEYNNKSINTNKVTTALKSAQGIISRFGEGIKKAGSHVASLGAKLKALGAKAVGSFKNMLPGLNTTESLLKRIIKLAKRVFIFTVLTKALRSVRQGIVDGVKAFMDYDTALKNNVNELKASLETLKMSAGAAFAPLVNAVVPAIKTIITWITEAINKINQLIAALSGRDTWTKATVSASDYAEATNSAADANKNLKKSLQGLYTLNVLGKNDDASGGSGGGGSTSSATKYTEEQVSSSISDLAKKIKEGLKGDEEAWTELGEMVRDKLMKAFNIDWESIYKKAQNFGTGFASFLNGLFKDDANGGNIFGTVATTITGALNTVFKGIISFADKFDWAQLGTAIDNGINKALDSHVITFALEAAAKMLSGIVTTIYEVVSKKDTWSKLGTEIGNGINKFCSSFNWKKFGATLSSLVTGVTTALTKAIKKIKWKNIGKAIGEFLENIDWKAVVMDLGKLAKAIASALCEAIKGLSSTKYGNIAIAIAALIGSAKITGSMLKGTALTSSVSGALSNALGTVAITVGVAIAGYKIGNQLYENNEAVHIVSDTIASTLVSKVTDLSKITYKLGLTPELYFDPPSQEEVNAITAKCAQTISAGKLIVPLNLKGQLTSLDMDLWTDADKEKVRDAIQNYQGDLNQMFKEQNISQVAIDLMLKYNIIETDGNGGYKAVETGVKDTATKAQAVADKNPIKLTMEEQNLDKLITNTKNTIKKINDGIKDSAVAIKITTKYQNKVRSLSWLKDTIKNIAKIPSTDAVMKIRAEYDKAALEETGKNAGKAFYNGFNKNYISIAEYGANGMPTDVLAKIKGTVIQTKKVGGLLEDGFFTMSKGEIVGSFFDGKSAVANDFQIINGIAQGVKAATLSSFAQIASAIQQSNINNAQSMADVSAISKQVADNISANVTFKVEGDPNGLFKVVQAQGRNNFRSTGRQAFVY